LPRHMRSHAIPVGGGSRASRHSERVWSAPVGTLKGGRCMSSGVVKWFNSEKGYGFITPDDGGRDLFVHYSEIQSQGYRELFEGQKVEFEVTEGRKGPQASAVRPV